MINLAFSYSQGGNTLVDQVEESLLSHFKCRNLQIGDPIPNENTLAEELGVSRSVLRECLSRLKMFGMINSRPRKGMILSEPAIMEGMSRIMDPHFLSEHTVLELLEFRIALEIGISSSIFEKITDEDISALEEIVKIGKVTSNNEYAVASESLFHSRLYDVTGNRTIAKFQSIIHPVLTYIKRQFSDELTRINREFKAKGLTASHADLLDNIKRRDKAGYLDAIERHFEPYRIFMRMHAEASDEILRNAEQDSD